MRRGFRELAMLLFAVTSQSLRVIGAQADDVTEWNQIMIERIARRKPPIWRPDSSCGHCPRRRLRRRLMASSDAIHHLHVDPAAAPGASPARGGRTGGLCESVKHAYESDAGSKERLGCEARRFSFRHF